MSRSWSHHVSRLDEAIVDRNDRFGSTCATGKCTGLPTHAIGWDYVTGRAGRVSYATWHVCTGHGTKFAAKHQLTVLDPQPEQPSAVAAAMQTMVGGEARQVRVFRSRHGSTWYVEYRREGGGLLSASNRWLSGVRGDASLGEAVVEAEILLAQDLQVPAGGWREDNGEAIAEIAAAYRVEPWASRPWGLRIDRAAAGMWQLTRSLDDRFRPLTNRLGWNNMSLQRAIRVADNELASERWVTTEDQWIAYDDDTAMQGGWHPDQMEVMAP